MERIAVYVDASNIYKSVKSKYNAAIDFKKYYEFCGDFGDITIAKFYSANSPKNRDFFRVIKSIGYELRVKDIKHYEERSKCDWDTGMTVDMIRDLDLYDKVILGSSDCDMLEGIRYIQERGKEVMILSCTVSREIVQHLSDKNVIELPKSLIYS